MRDIEITKISGIRMHKMGDIEFKKFCDEVNAFKELHRNNEEIKTYVISTNGKLIGFSSVSVSGDILSINSLQGAEAGVSNWDEVVILKMIKKYKQAKKIRCLYCRGFEHLKKMNIIVSKNPINGSNIGVINREALAKYLKVRSGNRGSNRQLND